MTLMTIAIPTTFIYNDEDVVASATLKVLPQKELGPHFGTMQITISKNNETYQLPIANWSTFSAFDNALMVIIDEKIPLNILAVIIACLEPKRAEINSKIDPITFGTLFLEGCKIFPFPICEDNDEQ